MILLSFFFAFIGFASLGLTSAKHHGWLLGGAVTARRKAFLRIGACMAFAASLVAAMAGWGVSQGSVGWFGMLSLCAATLLIIRTCIAGRSRQ